MTGQEPSLRFIALMAFLFSLVAISIDMMLSSLADIGNELSPAAPENAQLVLSVFFLGLGIGTIFAGPIADAYGRRPLVLWGLAVYAVGAAMSWLAPSLELMMLGRALQGLGASAPRVACMAVIRDRFSGAPMARALSLVFMIFTVIPAAAPLMGEGVAALAGWRTIFLVFVICAVVGGIWFGVQQPETLPPADHRPLRLGTWLSEMLEVLKNAQTRNSLLVQLFIFGSLYSWLVGAALVFEGPLDLAEAFPWILGFMSLTGAISSFTNARVVERLGTLLIIRASTIVWLVISVICTALILAGVEGNALRATFIIMMWSGFLILGFTIGNSNAIALQPMGHIAGTAAATVNSLSTLGAGLLTVLITVAYDGTARPVVIGVCIFAAAALWFTYRLAPEVDPEPTPEDART
ncbi:MAG: MFS transporter [Pseudomonadota bacterium]